MGDIMDITKFRLVGGAFLFSITLSGALALKEV
jgi:hypothetical protein